jgi:thioredoxin-related protein
VQFGIEKRKTLFLVFSRTCKACDANWPSWRTLIEATKKDSRARIVYLDISASPRANYFSGHNIPVESLIVKPDPVSAFLLYNIRSTPQTILASQDGKVEKVSSGVMGGRDIRSWIEALDAK